MEDDEEEVVEEGNFRFMEVFANQGCVLGVHWEIQVVMTQMADLAALCSISALSGFRC